MSLSKSKCWFSNNCLHSLKHTVPLLCLVVLELVLWAVSQALVAALMEGLRVVFTADFEGSLVGNFKLRQCKYIFTKLSKLA
jgi:hypothetical protein